MVLFHATNLIMVLFHIYCTKLEEIRYACKRFLKIRKISYHVQLFQECLPPAV